MTPTERDELLTRLAAIKASVLELQDVPTTFAMGAFYVLEQTEQVIQAAYREHPTCLITCRNTKEE